MKIIAVLRNPFDRTISHYRWLVQLGKIKNSLNFNDAIVQYPELVDNSLYGNNVNFFYNIFGEDNVLLINYDLIKDNPSHVLTKTFDFVGVNNSFMPKILN